MSPAEYILDPQFECTGLAVKYDNNPTEWIEGDHAGEFFADTSEDVICVSHNALFDMSIAAWRYGWVPKLMVDTLGLARANLQQHQRSMALDKIGELLGLGRKTDGLANVRAMRLADIRAHPELHRKFIEYGKNDVDLCKGIYDALVPTGIFPMKELVVMDMVLRTTVMPQFVVDIPLLEQSLAEIRAEKDLLLTRAELMGADPKKTLMSNQLFAEMLREHGVEPPMKVSPLTGRATFAFAKSDQEFLDLLEHPNPAVRILVEARMGHKSTIEETRHQRFINIGKLHWPETKLTKGGQLGLMPMPLKYSGAHTHRLSGDWSMNVQNMGRGSTLRRSLKAPEGYVVIAGDESQIEARMLCTLAGQEDMRTDFEHGRDVYSIFATDLFKKPVSKKTPVERWVGKTAILGLGYNLGRDKFATSLPVLAQNQLKGQTLDMTREELEGIVDFYREKNHFIAASWKLLGGMGIRAMFEGFTWKYGPVVFSKDEVLLPNGTKLYFKNLRQIEGGMYGLEWVFDYEGMVKRIYGGKLMENICQALARIIVMDAAVNMRKRLARINNIMALQVHDELVCVVRKEHAEVTRMVMEYELKRRPTWLPNLPLDCEIEIGENYGDMETVDNTL